MVFDDKNGGLSTRYLRGFMCKNAGFNKILLLIKNIPKGNRQGGDLGIIQIGEGM